jgi:uncharacterized damage-inducible protein DinB
MQPNELQRLLLHNAAFTPPPRILAAIPLDLRAQRPSGAPHSIVEELWHLVFWQDLFLRWARREPLPYPEHAELGWQRFDSVGDSQWQSLVSRFTAGVAEAAEIAGERQLGERYSTLEEPGAGTGPLNLLELIVNIAVHNAYHLGRIVQLRQMLGIWPPPEGGDTW